MLLQNDKSNNNYTVLLNLLFERPIITKKEISETLAISLPTANTIVETFCKLGILYDKTPEKKI